MRRATQKYINSRTDNINFYPRSPCGERPDPAPQGESSKKFLSTLSLRRATIHDFTALYNIFISIHALLAESDVVGASQGADVGHISIHALLAESDADGLFFIVRRNGFLSTLSLRRATCCPQEQYPRHRKFLSTLSLRRATSRTIVMERIETIFLSTLSLRRAT